MENATLNPDFVQELEHDQKTKEGMATIAAALLAAAIAHVPVVTGTTRGEYESRFSVIPGGFDGHPAGIAGSYPLWHIIEYGSVNNPPYRPFAKGAQSIGVQWSSK